MSQHHQYGGVECTKCKARHVIHKDQWHSPELKCPNCDNAPGNAGFRELTKEEYLALLQDVPPEMTREHWENEEKEITPYGTKDEYGGL